MSGGASRWVARRGRARLVRELTLLAALYALYSLSRVLVDVAPEEAVQRGLAVLGVERALGLDVEHGMVDALLGRPGAALLAGYLYASLHYTVTPAVLLWLYRCHPLRYATARTVLAGSTLLALVGYWRWPTAPPRLLPGNAYPDVLSLYSQWGWWGADASAPRGLGALTNEYAAMPSMHVGWALWCGLAVLVLARRPWVRLLGAAYPVLTVLVVLATSNHYLLDAVAGAAVVLAVGTAAVAHRAVGRARPADGPSAVPRQRERGPVTLHPLPARARVVTTTTTSSGPARSPSRRGAALGCGAPAD